MPSHALANATPPIATPEPPEARRARVDAVIEAHAAAVAQCQLKLDDEAARWRRIANSFRGQSEELDSVSAMLEGCADRLATILHEPCPPPTEPCPPPTEPPAPWTDEQVQAMRARRSVFQDALDAATGWP